MNARSPSDGWLPRQRGLLLLLLMLLVIDLCGLGWGLPHTVAPHPDDVAKPTLEALQQRFLEPTKYPKVHMLCVAAAYAPYLGALWLNGDLDLSGAGDLASSAELLRDPATVLSQLLFIARLTSVAAHLLAVLLIFRIALGQLQAQRPALCIAALFGLSPWMVFFAKTSTVDVPMILWISAAMTCAARQWTASTTARLAVFFCVCVLAVCTKEQAAFYLAPVCVVVVVREVSRLGPGAALRRLLPGVLGGLLLYALLNDLLWAPQLFLDRLGGWVAETQRWREQIMETPDGLTLTLDTVSYSLAVAGPGLVLASVWSACVCVRARSSLGALLVAQLLLYPALLVGFVGYVQPRYLMPQTVTMGLLLAHAWRLHSERGADRPALGGSRWQARAALVLLAISGVHAGLIAFEFGREPRREASRWLERNVPDGATVEYFQMINSLPGLTAAGLQPQRVQDMTLAGLAQRRPQWICIADSERWHWNGDQVRFVEQLVSGDLGDLGYRRVRFGRRGPDDERWYLPHGLDGRLRPEIVILERSGRD